MELYGASLRPWLSQYFAFSFAVGTRIVSGRADKGPIGHAGASQIVLHNSDFNSAGRRLTPARGNQKSPIWNIRCEMVVVPWLPCITVRPIQGDKYGSVYESGRQVAIAKSPSYSRQLSALFDCK